MNDRQYNDDDSLDLNDVLGEEYYTDFEDEDDDIDFTLPEDEDNDEIDPITKALNQFGLSDEEENILSNEED